MPHPTRRTFVKWAAVVLLMLVVTYPLSYAPVVRWEAQRLEAEGTRDGIFYFGMIDGTNLPAYKPVDWLIDNTPLDKPLFAWARVWGVDFEFETGSHSRQNGDHRPIPMLDPPCERSGCSGTDGRRKAHPLLTRFCGDFLCVGNRQG